MSNEARSQRKKRLGIKSLKKAKKRTLGADERRHKTAKLYLQGKTQSQIGELLGVTAATISNDLGEIRAIWRTEAKVHFDDRKAQEIAKLDRVEAEAWEAWERSCQLAESNSKRTEYSRTIVKKRGRRGAHKIKPIKIVEEVTKRGQAGDPRFLEQVERCVTMRLRVLGMLKGESTNVNQLIIDWTGLIGKPKIDDPVEKMIIEAENQAHLKLPEPADEVYQGKRQGS
jgi:predicted transcriptional regulator